MRSCALCRVSSARVVDFAAFGNKILKIKSLSWESWLGMHFGGAQLNFRAAELVVRYQPSPEKEENRSGETEGP